MKNGYAIAFSIILLLFLQLFSVNREVVGQPAVTVAAVIRPRQIQIGERAHLKLTLSGDTFIENIGAPRFNFLPAFLALPLHSSTTPHLASDKIAVSMAWAYELIPQAIGDFSLADIHFTYQGSTYFASPGSIRVSGDDTYRDNSTSSIHQVESEVDTVEPYLNAPLTYTFRYLYTAVLPTPEEPRLQLPTFRGFLVEKQPPLPQQTQQMQGKTFWIKEQVLRLYPQKMGAVTIEPAALLLPTPRGQKTLKTPPLKLNIRPLPEIGKPPQFSGAVGEYQVSAQVDRGSVETGTPLTLAIRISGRGNMQTVTAPELSKIPGTVVNGPTLVNGTITTHRIYEYTVVPTQTGTLRIPAIDYVYFDPNRAVYATAETLPIPVSVSPTPDEALTIDTDTSPWMFWLIVLTGLLFVFALLAVGYLWYRARSRRSTNAAISTGNGSGKQKAQNVAAESTTSAEQAREVLAAVVRREASAGGKALTNQLTQVLYQYLEDTFTLEQRNIDTAREACVQAGIPEQLCEELIDIFTTCDYHRFAPVTLTTNERNVLIARVEAVISTLERFQTTDAE